MREIKISAKTVDGWTLRGKSKHSMVGRNCIVLKVCVFSNLTLLCFGGVCRTSVISMPYRPLAYPAQGVYRVIMGNVKPSPQRERLGTGRPMSKERYKREEGESRQTTWKNRGNRKEGPSEVTDMGILGKHPAPNHPLPHPRSRSPSPFLSKRAILRPRNYIISAVMHPQAELQIHSPPPQQPLTGRDERALLLASEQVAGYRSGPREDGGITAEVIITVPPTLRKALRPLVTQGRCQRLLQV